MPSNVINVGEAGNVTSVIQVDLHSFQRVSGVHGQGVAVMVAD